MKQIYLTLAFSCAIGAMTVPASAQSTNLLENAFTSDASLCYQPSVFFNSWTLFLPDGERGDNYNISSVFSIIDSDLRFYDGYEYTSVPGTTTAKKESTGFVTGTPVIYIDFPLRDEYVNCAYSFPLNNVTPGEYTLSGCALSATNRSKLTNLGLNQLWQMVFVTEAEPGNKTYSIVTGSDGNATLEVRDNMGNVVNSTYTYLPPNTGDAQTEPFSKTIKIDANAKWLSIYAPQQRCLVGKLTLAGSGSGTGTCAPIYDSESAPAEYYNLQGIRVSEPEHGIYIERRNGTGKKVRL